MNSLAQKQDIDEFFPFGVITSNVHMAWMRTVAGKLKSDYRYSSTIVYNTFPWIDISEQEKKAIELTAQEILKVRAKYSTSSLASLYDDNIMHSELRTAHQKNDRAVMEAYKLKKIIDGKKTLMTESETVNRLFEMYEEKKQKNE